MIITPLWQINPAQPSDTFFAEMQNISLVADESLYNIQVLDKNNVTFQVVPYQGICILSSAFIT